MTLGRLMCLVSAFAGASARLTHGCPPEAAICKRGDFTGDYCVPLQVDVDMPIQFNQNAINFPSVRTVSHDYCTRYLDRYPWTTTHPKPGKKIIKWHRTDWVAGSCNCTLTKDEDVPKLRGTHGSGMVKAAREMHHDLHSDAHSFATTAIPGVLADAGKFGVAAAALGSLPSGGVCRWLGLGCQGPVLSDYSTAIAW